MIDRHKYIRHWFLTILGLDYISSHTLALAVIAIGWNHRQILLRYKNRVIQSAMLTSAMCSITLSVVQVPATNILIKKCHGIMQNLVYFGTGTRTLTYNLITTTRVKSYVWKLANTYIQGWFVALRPAVCSQVTFYNGWRNRQTT